MALARKQFDALNRHSLTTLAAALSATISLLGAAPAASAQWTRTATLTNDSGEADSHFGSAVALGSAGVVVSAPELDSLRTDQGAAQAYWPYGGYFYKNYVAWDLHGDARAGYGRSLDYDGATLIVGAPGEDRDAGIAYVRSSGGSTTELMASGSDRNSIDEFGWSVSMDNGTAVVGAPGDDELASNAGAVYVFNSPYTSSYKIKTGGASGGFGQAVAIDNGRIAASAPGYSTGYGPVGLVRIYEYSGGGWAVITTLTNPSYSVFNFGTSVDISGDIVVVGTETAGSNAGHAYVYDLSVSWTTPVAELTSPDGSNGDFFGYAVAVDGDRIIVGAPLYDHAFRRRHYTDCGAAYLYYKSGSSWVYEQRILPGFVTSNQQFGRSVDIRENRAIVGAPYKGLSDVGIAYVYER